MEDRFLDLPSTALKNLDWRCVTLSRVQYEHGQKPTGIGNPHWLERPFAYELYHQLRLIWSEEQFESDCVIHSEVYKKYQQIKDLEKMPDFLFHLPKPDSNLAVVEFPSVDSAREISILGMGSNPSEAAFLDKFSCCIGLARARASQSRCERRKNHTARKAIRMVRPATINKRVSSFTPSLPNQIHVSKGGSANMGTTRHSTKPNQNSKNS
jgi:hypothetical protein